ncbi:uncharacterized protein [Henckelia pumila]|uniref:uncharacterized protein n=1 Tax=Henckelia pumila TaxID=405737 RepID=UPI003C6E112D
MHLRLQDFKSINEYNSALFRISLQLKLCGEKITDDLLKKTYSTFHASNVVLQQPYREKGFKRYFDLISCLLVAEQNNELLMKNHEIHPTGANPFPEVNAATHDEKMKQNKTGFGRGRGRGRGRVRGRGHFHPHGRGHGKPRYFNDGYTNDNDQRNRNLKKWGDDQEKNVESGQNDKSMNSKNGCYRCGDKLHWYNNYRTPKHLVYLYQKSKEKEKDAETNFMYQGDDLNQV